MKITVAVCTWNRSRLLDRALTEMKRLEIPAGVEWELLVVNNNCTDDTDEVIQAHSRSLPIRRLFQPTPGKTHAANLAAEQARGDWILWTDDDVLVHPQWISAYAKAFERWPEASYLGGLIEPWFEIEPPRWVLRNLDLLMFPFAIRDYGEAARPFEDKEVPFGANMAVRRKVFEAVRFDPRLGPNPQDEIRGDDAAFVRELKRQGHVGVWVREARVKHYIPRHRLTPSYIWRYFIGSGQTWIRRQGIPEGKRWRGVPRWLFRRHLQLRFKSSLLRGFRFVNWVDPFIMAATTRGMIAECAAQNRALRNGLPQKS